MGLLNLYESKRRPIGQELIYDFVEGCDRRLTQIRVVLAVRGQTIKVTCTTMHKALDLVESVDRVPKDNTTGLLAIVSNAAEGHEAYPVEQCVATYRLQIAALMERLCFRKK